jgi:hypothetical protein
MCRDYRKFISFSTPPRTLNQAFLDASERRTIISHQVVNRSLKKDRLPRPDTERLVPDRKIETDCKPPTEVGGRCFA